VSAVPPRSPAVRHSPPGSRHLLLLRHGQSTANAAEEFSGWIDVPLTGMGQREAVQAARLIAGHGLLPDTVHTSLLSRSVATAHLGLAWLPVRGSWRLNQRHYGALQGRSKRAVRQDVGDDTFSRWRRSYREPPPPLARHGPGDPRDDVRYAALPPDALPRGESLADVVGRLVPYWQDVPAADTSRGLVPLVVAHGNSLRALVMHLDRLGDAEVAALNIPTGVPLRYDLGEDLRPLLRGGSYLDPRQRPRAQPGSPGKASEGARNRDRHRTARVTPAEGGRFQVVPVGAYVSRPARRWCAGGTRLPTRRCRRRRRPGCS